jgi:ubiquinone/menaquinone biosynthesis C-methylase UbiE
MDKRVATILDVGCGRGWPMQFINRKRKYLTVGADIFAPFLLQCKELGIYDGLVWCDIRKLPFKQRSFDVVLCLRVLEHLKVDEAERLLVQMEEIARKQVVIITPLGEHRQSEEKQRYPYYVHRSTWVPIQLEKLGYRVWANGVRNLQGETGILARLPGFFGHWGISYGCALAR